MKYLAAPNDSRYIPFTQQKACCVPTSISMIMYRNNIPLIPIEELGFRLGLTIPPEFKGMFYKPRVSDTPPSTTGYGTQIYNPEFEPNKIFAELDIPLSFDLILADKINDSEDLVLKLSKIENNNYDALLCFNHGVIRGEFKPFSGHVVVFDRIIDGQIRVVDASADNPKWQYVDPQLMFEAIQRHGNKASGGIWRFMKS